MFSGNGSCMMRNMVIRFNPQANGAKRHSWRKPGARVTIAAWLFTPG